MPARAGPGACLERAGRRPLVGRVAVENDRQVVQRPEGGVVARIHVREGDRVAAGDPLIRLDAARLASERQILLKQLREVTACAVRPEAERHGADALRVPPDLLAAARRLPQVADTLKGQRNLFDSGHEARAREEKQLRRRLARTVSQVAGVETQRAATRRQPALLREELADQATPLERGLAQAPHVSALRRDKARLEVRAPVSSMVHETQVFAERSVVRPAGPVLYVVSQDRPFVIQKRVEPIHVDQVLPGQPVTLRLPAFDARTTPELFGKVIRVSADALVDEATGASYYQAEILPDPGEVAKLGDRVLLPGMPVEAYLRTDDRTPIGYLVKPLADYFNRAFREG